MPPKPTKSGAAKSTTGKTVKKAPAKGASSAAKSPATATATPAAPKPPPAPVRNDPVVISLKQMDSIVMNEPTGEFKESGRFPYIIDEGGMSGTFLRHRDTNYFVTADQANMACDKIRIGLLGAMRFGKPFVLDMFDADMCEISQQRFDEIMPGLWDSIFDKSIMKEEKFMKLVKEEDGEMYQKAYQFDIGLPKFTFVVLCKDPSEHLLDRMFTFKIQ